MTTLEDVFLKLEVEAEIDQAGKNRTKNISQWTRQDKKFYKQINYATLWSLCCLVEPKTEVNK